MEILGKVVMYSVMLLMFAGLGCVLGFMTCFFTDMFLKRFFESCKVKLMNVEYFAGFGFLWYSSLIVYLLVTSL